MSSKKDLEKQIEILHDYIRLLKKELEEAQNKVNNQHVSPATPLSPPISPEPWVHRPDPNIPPGTIILGPYNPGLIGDPPPLGMRQAWINSYETGCVKDDDTL